MATRANVTQAAADTALRPSMTPEAALGRHIEWLEYALGAAREEETYRMGRLEKASPSNREKRERRVAEAREEIDELTALLAAIRDLQDRAGVRQSGSAAASSSRRQARNQSTTSSLGPAEGGAEPSGNS